MCPCSCTQNLSKSYKKRETSPGDAEVVAKAAAEPVAEAASTTKEVKVEVEEVKAEASAPEVVKVELQPVVAEHVAAALEAVKVEAPAAAEPVAAASEPVKVEAPAEATVNEDDKSKITTTN